MNIFICGQKSFGKAVLKKLYEAGHTITGIAPAPQGIKKDKMVGYALLKGIPVISDCDKLSFRDIPENTDLIVAAHSHWIISDRILESCKYGGIGFHPSLLPRHRGRDAVRWAVAMGDFASGGTVYRLGGKCDGGEILLQELVFIDKAWDYHDLWGKIFPIGVDMLLKAVNIIERGEAIWREQDERFATFEPSWDRPRLKRNDLIMIGGEAEVNAGNPEICKGCIRDCEFCTMHIAEPDKYKK